MKMILFLTAWSKSIGRSLAVALTCASLLLPGNVALYAQTPEQAGVPTATPPAEVEKIPAEQLDALVAPIALYPDPLLSQTLVASTYPLEVIQLHQWLQKNKELSKDQKKLVEKVAKQPWDASIQAMAPLPDVVKWLAEDVQWTTDLGNAFLAQQQDVMAAVQRMRAKAKEKGALASNEQMKVETKVVETKQVIVIEQANPQVVYVPSYNPVHVYGTIGYPYPPIYYPPYYGTGAVIAAGAIGFGVGVAIGAAWGGGWGWGAGWGGGDIDINVNNNFNRNTNISGGNRINNIQGGDRTNIGNGNRVNQGGKWQHNASHRGGAPYGDKNTANKFGGSTRGDSLSNRQTGARQQLGRQGGSLPSTSNVSNRGTGLSDRSGNLGTGNRGAGISDRSTGGNRGAGIGDRSTGGNRGSNLGSGSLAGSSTRMGNRDIGSASRSGGFGGGSGSSARSSSTRGMSSMGGGSRGGFSGGGGMRGGGRRR